MRVRRIGHALAFLSLLAFSACTGTVSGQGGNGGGVVAPGQAGGGAGMGSGVAGGSTASGSAGAGIPASGPAPCVQSASFAQARLSLISDEQYRNVVRDAFGVTFPANAVITTPPSTSGTYPFNENAQMQTTTLQAYQRSADQVASLVTSFPPCAAGAVDATCFEQYLRKTLPTAWRRPPSDVELAGLMTVFATGAQDGQTVQVQLTFEAALLHAAFLYKTEIGTGAATATGPVSLTPYEVASSLSFALLDSAPDAPLFAKAQDGTILQPPVLAAEVTRLLALPAARASLTKKVSYFLDFEALPFVQKDATTFPTFAALQPTLYRSAQMFVNDVVWSGHLADLFTSRRIYANQAMASAYGLPAVSGTDLQPITTSGDAYSGGVLTQPALLAASDRNAVGDDVVHRGLWIHDNLLCAPPLPPPPAGATAIAAMITGSTRQQAMTRDMGCGIACHGHFDPFGLVTLDYDGIGRYRTTDPTTTPPGGPIDTTATVAAGLLLDQPNRSIALGGVSDLAQLLSNGRQVSDCAAGVLATYMLEHSPDTQNSCAFQAVRDRFQQTGSFAELFTALLTSPAFLARDP